MYLKRVYSRDGYHYLLSESYLGQKCWKHRVLMDLGTDPGLYFEYPGGNSFHVREDLLQKVQSMTDRFSEDELETLLMPFLDPHIRQTVEWFERPKEPFKPWQHLSSDEVLVQQRELHFFDKRRIHYLRFGRIQMGNLDRRPLRFFQLLHKKSRDEIEAMIDKMELALPPHERRVYVYTAFHLQTRFPGLSTRNHPSALDPEKVDEFFMESICALNRDRRFFRGTEPHDLESLHPYLIKYLILYFDNDFVPGTFWAEYVEDFMWKHQFYRRPKARPRPSPSHEEACRCLEISLDDFQKMDRAMLTRCYRKLAKRTHPDRGGDAEHFVEIKAAYEILMEMK